MNPTDIFFSYSHIDHDRVKPIIEAFKTWGWEVFYDREIDSGEDWEQVLEDRLQRMYAVIVAWSIHSIESRWVLREAKAGLQRNRLFSIKLDPRIELPDEFKKVQAVDFTGWSHDAKDAVFKHVLNPLENLWTSDNGMALIRTIKVSRPLQLRSQ
jgi:hypothetical protein